MLHFETPYGVLSARDLDLALAVVDVLISAAAGPSEIDLTDPPRVYYVSSPAHPPRG